MSLSPRLGSVPYLNSEPLIYGLDPAPVRLVPSRLSQELHAGRLDAALIPIVEYLRHADRYALVDHAAIASRGPVYSVILISDRPVREIATVALDPDSRTSAMLVRVLLEIGQRRAVRYVPEGEEADARLLIGNPAISFRRANPERAVLDLGQLWSEWTGHPFVYAAWAVRRAAATPELADRLRAAMRAGIAARHRIACTPEDLDYLTHSIWYDLGPEEKAGLSQFARYLVQLGELPDIPPITWI